MKTPLKWNYKKQIAEHRSQITDKSNNEKHGTPFVVLALCSVFCVLSFGCATPSSKLPAPPPKYVHQPEEKAVASSVNSLWYDSDNIFEDRKARRINDLVTINVIESLSGSGTADTDTSRKSTMDFALEKFFGAPLDFGVQDRTLFKHLFDGGQFEPEIKSTASSAFKGEGDTNREGELIATITAKVVEVMPNGNLALEARKELTINNEKQILVLGGVVRPDDIASDNTISSTKIADARIYYVGDGVLQEKQSPGWMVRALDYAWPF